MIKLKEIEAPKPEGGLIPVMLSDEAMQNRKAHPFENMQKDGFDAVVVYADLEHGSNFGCLYGFLPRFEEALLILHANGKALMVLGNENLNKVGEIRIETVPIHMPHFSLPNQPMQTEKSVTQILIFCELGDAEKIGLVGWKNFTSHVEDNRLLFDLPYFLIEALKTIYGEAQFASVAYLLAGENGIRATNNANGFVHYEYGTALAGNYILKTMDRLKVGKMEMEVAEALAADGQRHSVVAIMTTGARFKKASLCPGNKQIQCGDKISITTGFREGLQNRASYAVECTEQLPEREQGYLKAAAIPYFQAVKTWLETIEIGINGNDLHKAVETVLPKEDYGWTLNPGHLCADKEWVSSPIYSQFEETLQSGMLFQIDIIPGVNGYGGVSCEGGILLADERLWKAIAKEYPTVWEHIAKHGAYMQEMLGIRIQEDVLPTNMTTAYLRPYLLKKEMALTSVWRTSSYIEGKIMKPEKLRMVVCGIDSTLVVKHHALTKKAKEATRKLRKRHIVFGLASGYSLAEVRGLLHRWGLEDVDMPIRMSGSTLWDNLTKKEETYYRLKKEWIRETIERMSVFTCNPVIYRNACIYCKRMDEVMKQSATLAEMKTMRVTDMKVFYQEEDARVTFRVNEEDILQIEAYLTVHPSRDYRLFKTQSTLMEFSHRRISKAYTLKKFREKHQISTAEVMAFGDTTNEHTMLKPSGVGVCLKNSSDGTKVIADIIADYPCDEGGWAHFMEMYTG